VARAFIAVGSNIEPEQNVREGLRRLSQRLSIKAVSTFYRSLPLGRPEQQPFINGVVEVETDVPPEQLKYGVLRAVESEMGRVRTADTYAPRTLDLDILLYDARMISSPDLTVPDPDIVSRPFLAVPLAELAPEAVLPGDGRSLRAIAGRFAEHGMERLATYTEEVRRELANGSRQSKAAR
jgi:dihydroneopterin aldolase/2-amino-4-hydroxy-6-hydroxymethyldihydropteridine diphosphokinase